MDTKEKVLLQKADCAKRPAEYGQPDRFAERIRLYMEKEKMACRGSRILAAVSGGADSVCLLMLLVRQLDPTPEGLPLQLYFFTRPKDWPTHERIAAEVMEHVIASLPAFGLRAYQRPAGTDLPSSGGSRTAA